MTNRRVRPDVLPTLLLALSAGLPSGLAVAEPVRYDGHMVVRATIETPRQVLAASTIAESVWSHHIGPGGVDLQVTAEQLAALEALGVRSHVLIPDVQALIDAEQRQIADARLREDITWFQTYRTLDEHNARLAALAAARPDLASTQNLGNSLQGREIRAIRVSAPDQPGNPRSGRAQILFNGGQHAREWVSPMTLTYIADRLVTTYDTDARVRALLDRAEIILVPIMNPDGYVFTWTNNRLWRKNLRDNGNGTIGVDLNRNWSFGWGQNGGSSTDPASETYRGAAPFSEPETRVIRDLMLASPRLEAHIDFHSYSQLIMSPWGYTTQAPPDALLFERLNAQLEAAVESVNGADYRSGQVSTILYVASGAASDYSYGQLGAIGYSVELRDTGRFGFTLPADQIVPTATENFEGAMVLAEFVSLPIRISLAGAVPASIPAGQPWTVDVSVTDGTETLNLASPRVFWRSTGQPFDSAPLAALGGGLYRATLPAEACGRTVEIYFSAESTTGTISTLPTDAPASIFATTVVSEAITYDDACESASGWTVGAPGDAAVRGVWENADPEPTAAQPGDDRSPFGTRCWVTGAAAGASLGALDVDGGATTLTSPRFDATSPHPGGEAFVSYWRWYSDSQGSNPDTNSMPISISNDDGATWTQLEAVTDDGAWVFREFRVADFVTPTDRMRLRFVARDLTGSLVEAAVDDLRLVVRGCPPSPADFNGDGFVDFFDYDAFVECFEGGVCPPGRTADFNGDGFTDFFDFDDFVRAFEVG